MWWGIPIFEDIPSEQLTKEKLLNDFESFFEDIN